MKVMLRKIREVEKMGLKEKSRTSKLGGKPTSIHAFGGLFKPRTQPALAVALSLILFVAASLLIVPYAKAADPGHAASSISSGTFETGDYVFPSNLTVTRFFIANGTTLFVDAINGRVGIGTTGPTQKLEVTDGNIYITDTNGKLYLDDGSHYLTYNGANLVFFNGVDGFQFNNNSASLVTIQQGGNVGIGSASPNYLLETKVTEKAVNLSSILYVNGTSGNVGIGTASPGAKLDVGGKLSVTGGYTATTGQNGIHFGFSSNIGTIYSLEEGAGWRDLKIDAANLLLETSNAGKVGIGTASPSATLQVNSSSGAGSLQVQNTTGASHLFVNGTSGNVGIGTAGPGSKLQVSGNAYVTGRMGVGMAIEGEGELLSVSGSVNNDYGMTMTNTHSGGYGLLVQGGGASTNILDLKDYSGSQKMVLTGSGNVGIGTAGPGAYHAFLGGGLEINHSTTPDLVLNRGGLGAARISFNSANNLVFNVKDGASSSINAMVINSTNGNVGIGTTSPGSKLDVAGDINASSGSVIFYNEIMPDGATCSNGQILKKTGANDWDCADDTGGGGNSTEEMQDAAGGLFGGTETLITVTYDDANNDTDFVVPEMRNTTEEMQDAVGGAFDTTLNHTDASNLMGLNRTWLNNSGVSNSSWYWGNFRVSSGACSNVCTDADTSCSLGACTVGSDDTLTSPTVGGNLDMGSTYYITNIGHASTDFTTGGGLTLNGNFSVLGTGTHTIAGNSNFDGNTLFVNASTHYVGIGTASPTSSLTINSSNSYGGFEVTNSTGSSRFFVNASSGKVSIGTNDPTFGLGTALNSKFSVANYDTAIAAGYNSTIASFALNPNSNGSFTIYDHAAGSWQTGINQNSGKVGIGTASPSKKLEVSDGTKAITFDPAASTPTINTTASYNLTITSSGGNVIILLG